MGQLNLILTIPQESVVATSLSLEGFARHRSPGAGRYFEGRAIYIDVALDNGKLAFPYLEEGGWRDATGDTATALAACTEQNKRTKTALSNNGFSVTPIEGFGAMCLAKTGGQVLYLQPPVPKARYVSHVFKEGLLSDGVAEAAGVTWPAERHPHMYLVLAPIELVVLSNLLPEEYAWYALHRPGKVFRQVLFTEIKADPRGLVAESVYEEARKELLAAPSKKTKTVYSGSALNRVGFQAWVGYDEAGPGGIYCGNRDGVQLWRFPDKRPAAWDRADG